MLRAPTGALGVIASTLQVSNVRAQNVDVEAVQDGYVIVSGNFTKTVSGVVVDAGGVPETAARSGIVNLPFDYIITFCKANTFAPKMSGKSSA